MNQRKRETGRSEALWRELLIKSWEPRQWFHGRDEEVSERSDPSQETEVRMWVYRRIEETDLWQVGFYDPQGHWHYDSDHPNQRDAQLRVRWLNGGRMDQ